MPISREMVTLAGMAAVTLALVWAAPGATRDLALGLSIFLARSHDLDLTDGSAFRLAGVLWLRGSAPFVLAAMLGTAVAA